MFCSFNPSLTVWLKAYLWIWEVFDCWVVPYCTSWITDIFVTRHFSTSVSVGSSQVGTFNTNAEDSMSFTSFICTFLLIPWQLPNLKKYVWIKHNPCFAITILWLFLFIVVYSKLTEILIRTRCIDWNMNYSVREKKVGAFNRTVHQISLPWWRYWFIWNILCHDACSLF